MSEAAVAPATRSWRLTRPLDLRATLGQLHRGGPGDPSTRIASTSAARATNTPLGLGAATYSLAGDEVRVEAWGPGAPWLLEHAPALLGEGDDASGFRPVHPLIRDLARRFAGMRMSRSDAVFEALVPTVMEQKVIGAEARAGYRRMVRSLGSEAPGPLRLRVPPGPGTLGRLPYFEYHRFALEQRRANVVIRAAREAHRLEALLEADAASARAWLELLPGIGPWSAAEITMVAMGDADAVSVGDYHLPNIVSFAFTGEPRGDDARMLELLQPFRGHRCRVIKLLMAGGVQAPRRGPRLALRHMERH